MIYKISEDGMVNLEMTPSEYSTIILALGMANYNDPKIYWGWIAFANRLNETNPGFVPYSIPEDFG